MLRKKVPVRYRNPHASTDLTLDLEVIENTPPEEIESNTRHNAGKYDKWLKLQDETDKPAILIGGGDSINDHIEEIKELQKTGTVYAMNAASQWARKNGIRVDYQVILDAKPESAELVDPKAGNRLIASQCNPKTAQNAGDFTLWHLSRPGVEELFPPEKVKEGGYTLVGGDSSVGVCALCAVYILGHRDLHIFGYDTSYREGKGHGYEQKINKTMPTMKTDWAGEEYTISIAMKDQCRNFMLYAKELETMGCTFSVYGEGLLQTIWRADPSNLSEKDKYRLIWMFPQYREISPGEHIADFYLEQFKPEGKVIDFGCGTGRAGVKFKAAGLEPILVDFADNCRDEAAEDLYFVEWDLTQPIPGNAEHGFCTDVMEHIPTGDVETVIRNIMNAANKTFFQISTIDDTGGDLIGADLHLTVKPHPWWKELFQDMGYKVDFAQNAGIASLFYVSNRKETIN